MQKLCFVLVVLAMLVTLANVPATSFSHAQVPPATLAYPAGWSIIGVPVGTAITGNIGALYTYQAGDSDYEVLPVGTELQPELGYWAYFPHKSEVQLAPSVASANVNGLPAPTTLVLPAGQWVMVGDPYGLPVTITGMDRLLFYSGTQGYVQVSGLEPGEGGWAYSAAGGSAVLSPQPPRLRIPPTCLNGQFLTDSGCNTQRTAQIRSRLRYSSWIGQRTQLN